MGGGAHMLMELPLRVEGDQGEATRAVLETRVVPLHDS